VLLPFGLSWRANESFACGTSSPVGVEARSPCSCGSGRRRASKLTWCTAGVVAMGKVSKALWLIHLISMYQIDLPVASPVSISPPETRMSCRATTGGVCSAIRGSLTSGSRPWSRL